MNFIGSYKEDNDDLDMLYVATRRSEGSSHGQIRRHRGSVPGHKMVNRDRVEGHEKLYRDYFATPCVYESFFSKEVPNESSSFSPNCK